MSRDLLDLVRELNTLNDDNLADRVIENSDVQWCLSELQDILEEMSTLTPPNEPLTLDELRQMDGQPVWGKSLITGKPGEWFIVRIVEMSKSWFIACAGATQGFGDKDTYGTTWFAYRRPPERAGNA